MELTEVSLRDDDCGSIRPVAGSLSGWSAVAIAGAWRSSPGENSYVCSNGFAAGLRSGGPHFRAAVVDGGDAPAGAGRRRDQGQGCRARTAELAWPRPPDPQLLCQPVR